ncbi:pogo transposable element with krab domain [Plakobranchus ocellatus]|uniref:Pogo transposable element with krab domain n=1 Tax=Plakobranchus ocellatus TaxID=259542 RepID=A0AAV4DZR1_9GAST|nr:pogo transposable element with krab domain [Plakobranchus ocellatus]
MFLNARHYLIYMCSPTTTIDLESRSSECHWNLRLSTQRDVHLVLIFVLGLGFEPLTSDLVADCPTRYKRSEDSRTHKKYSEQQLADAMADISSGFRATGLHLFNSSEVLNKLPLGKNEARTADTSSAAVFDAVLDVLSSMRGGRKGYPTPKKHRRPIRMNVIPGKSVSLQYLSAPSSIAHSTPTPPVTSSGRESFFPNH